jgi:hypothetical protein
MERLQWFIDKIGQRIYRNDVGCCKRCQEIAQEGLIVNDEMHANYLFDMEIAYQQDGAKLMYFETKEQALNYENWVK